MKTQILHKEDLGKSLELVEGERYRLIIRPKAVLLRFSGVLFDTNKNFLLPACVPHLRQLSKVYTNRPDNQLLIVGHTDTSGEKEYNDRLSLERARAVEAFLKRDVAAWLARYESGVPEKKRWGSAEDVQMIGALPVRESEETEPTRQFQSSRGLKVDGLVGPQTRTALITEYMALPGLELPSSIAITVHGCGEHFPLDPSGMALDLAPADGQHDALDRRVELYFFDGAIEPPPPGENSTADSPEYKQWRNAALLIFDHSQGPSPTLRVRFEFKGEPAANERYSLRVDGHLLATSQTTSDGLVDQVIPDGAEVAEITFLDLKIVRTLSLVASGEFPSVDTPQGVQLRLNQLGFFAGPVDGDFSEVSQTALASFKRNKGLADDAVLDAATTAALVEAYGS